MAAFANIDAARQAVVHVQASMTIGASNKIGDILRSLIGPETSLTCVSRIRKDPYEGETVIQKLRSMAARAEAAGCGNCGEQAAIAFVYLMGKAIGPLDYMSRMNADHAFVVIGRTGAIEDTTRWGDTCVICDPWDGKAYLASEVSDKMYGGGVFAPRSVARWT